MAGVGVVRQHVRQARAAQALQRPRVGRAGDDQDHAVHVGGQQLRDGLLLLRFLVARHDGHDGVAARRRRLGDALQALGKDRVEQGGQHHAQHAAALGAQRAGAGVGLIAELARRALHQVARGGRHLVGKVERPGHGRGRDAGARGDVVDVQGFLGHWRGDEIDFIAPREYDAAMTRGPTGLTLGIGGQRSRRTRSSSSRIRQAAPTVIAASATLKAGKCQPRRWKSRKSTT